MAHVQPSAFAGSSSCDFCKTAPATVLVNGYLACERHKHSEIVDFGSSANSGGGSSSGGSKRDKDDEKNDDDDDVLEVWDPIASSASAVSPSTPPSKAPVMIPSSSNSSGIRGAPVANAPAGSQKRSGPLVPASPWGSPAAPLALSDDDDDDDVRFTGTTLGSGVVDLASDSTTIVRGVKLGGGSSSSSSSSSGGGGGGGGSGGGGSSNPHRARRQSLPPPPVGAEIVDLAAASAFSEPIARGQPRTLGGAASGGGGSGGRQHVIGTPPNKKAAETVSTKRRAQAVDQLGVVRVDKIVDTMGVGAGAGGSAGAKGAGGGSPSSAAVKVKGAPSATKAGKGRPKKKQRKLKPEVPCIVCFEDSAVDKCARCPEGHAMCKQCVTSYVTETLMPQGTVRLLASRPRYSLCGHGFAFPHRNAWRYVSIASLCGEGDGNQVRSRRSTTEVFTEVLPRFVRRPRRCPAAPPPPSLSAFLAYFPPPVSLALLNRQIFWDTIKCGGSSSCGHLFGPSVTALLPRLVIRKIETKQVRWRS